MLSEVGMPSTALQKGFVHTANLLRLKAEEEIIKDSLVPPYFGQPPPHQASVPLSPWHAAIISFILTCAPLPGPLSCPGRCLY